MKGPILYRRSFPTLASLILLAAAAPARACDQDPFFFTLPGDTEAKSQERAKRIFADRAVAKLFNRETRNFEAATKVYLARVISRTRLQGSVRSTVVTPLKSLKGKQKTDRQTLTDDGGPGLCDDRGDGLGAYADINALVVVFEGLPVTTERPRGMDSLEADDVRSSGLLYALLGLYGTVDQ